MSDNDLYEQISDLIGALSDQELLAFAEDYRSPIVPKILIDLIRERESPYDYKDGMKNWQATAARWWVVDRVETLDLPELRQIIAFKRYDRVVLRLVGDRAMSGMISRPALDAALIAEEFDEWTKARVEMRLITNRFLGAQDSDNYFPEFLNTLEKHQTTNLVAFAIEAVDSLEEAEIQALESLVSEHNLFNKKNRNLLGRMFTVRRESLRGQ